MNVIDAISIPFYKFTNIELVDEILDEVKKLEYRASGNNNGYISPNYYNKKLFNFFNDSIDQVKKIYYKDNLNFPITDCWVNKYNKLNSLNKHIHSNALICGVYYLTNHDNEGSTNFEAPNPWDFSAHSIGNFSLSISKNPQPLVGKINAEPGTLVLFPSSLYHYMKVLTKTNQPKYSIAFNTFASGIITDILTQQLELQIVTLEDKISK